AGAVRRDPGERPPGRARDAGVGLRARPGSDGALPQGLSRRRAPDPPTGPPHDAIIGPMPAARPIPLTPAAGAARPSLLNLSPLAQLRAGRLRRRLMQLFFGLTLFGLSIALMLQGG